MVRAELTEKTPTLLVRALSEVLGDRCAQLNDIHHDSAALFDLGGGRGDELPEPTDLELDPGLPGRELRAVEHLDRHAELVGDLRVGFLLGARDRPDLYFDIHLDHDLRRAVGPRARRAYVPDALIAATKDGEPAIALAYEIDRGFESISVFAGKIAATIELARTHGAFYGYAAFRPIALVPTIARVCAISMIAWSANGSPARALLRSSSTSSFGGSFTSTPDSAARESRRASLSDRRTRVQRRRRGGACAP